MSGAPKSFVIRDPIHGYVRIASHERVIVDHPITQRLRHVLQTGLAHLVFPEARTSRFVHSLGAMHLASRFLVASLENAEAAVADALFEEVEGLDAFRHIKPADMDSLLAPLSGEGGLLASRAAFPGQRFAEEERKRRRVLAFAEAGLRLAALFHDLGHLPFSHDLEFALDAFAQNAKRQASPGESLHMGVKALLESGLPAHEAIGHQLAKLVLDNLVDPQTGPGVRAVYQLARDILDMQPPYEQKVLPKANVLHWLHSLVDGEVDADRGDYLLRDGRALGFEFAAYDLERLVGNLVLVRDSNLGFTTAIREAGLSALETFFLSRSNLAMVRHHKNAQAGAAFRYASLEVLKRPAGLELVNAIGAIFAARVKDDEGVRAALNQFATFDDAFWWQALRELRRSASEPLLVASLDLVLNRSATLRSLWKRKGNVAREKVLRLNQLLEDPDAKERVGATMNRLAGRGVLLLRHKFTPFKTFKRETRPEGVSPDDDSLVLIRTERGLQPAASLSSIIRGLREAWKEEPHLHAFVLASNHTLDADGVLDEFLRT
ncbi:HD domain-containing protein [Pyxidicoccus sp. MSG2]|uniref:HD domain-containing protein n=1 Tax=Pyxidicoccus sp. MSG2 TaxID=2996790 RepID=UPI00226DC740|nr:HD domain-containing protein [Pyxidicoccus sp. MSG2]MCY1017605.1 HD domain-containing protein [Pyxidicoccus sp. MSG2]